MESTSVHMSLINEEEMVKIKDWRKALRAQPAYRIVNRTIRGQTQFICIVGLTGLLLLIILYLFPMRRSTSIMRSSGYNYTYPMTRPIRTNTMHTFRVGIIADLDTDSKSPNEKTTWYSYFKKGYLSYNPNTHSVVVTWDIMPEPEKLKSNYASKGRGVELSELVTFDGRLLTVDDRTGIVFEIVNNNIIPWVLLMDGDGRTSKGFKSEWATVKDEILYVGSMGKEWTTASGEFENHNPQYIKAITTKGQISHINWIEDYKRIRAMLGISWPGYMIHESAVWSDVHRRWFFLPRRCSKEKYNESLDEHRGCSVLISADENVHDLQVVEIKNSEPTRGFSSFKFVPTSNDHVIVALRTEELEGKTSTYITAFTIKGEILLDDLHIADSKYEGFEFI